MIPKRVLKSFLTPFDIIFYHFLLFAFFNGCLYAQSHVDRHVADSRALCYTEKHKYLFNVKVKQME